MAFEALSAGSEARTALCRPCPRRLAVGTLRQAEAPMGSPLRVNNSEYLALSTFSTSAISELDGRRSITC